MYEPIRGGTRGGQGDFKWTDVSADKDREHYLGHSINAPTGRWQKNKDVHWYNREKNDSEDAKAKELAQIKEAEREAMSIALGFKPSKPAGDAAAASATSTTTSGANAIPIGASSGNSGGPSTQLAHRSTSPGNEGKHSQLDQGEEEGRDGGSEGLSKEERRARRAEKKLAKEERRREKQEERERKAMELVARQMQTRQRSASPPRRRGDKPLRHEERERERGGRDRGYSGDRSRERERSERGYAREREIERPRRDYDGRAMEKERERDRRRWEDNKARQDNARGDWDRA